MKNSRKKRSILPIKKVISRTQKGLHSYGIEGRNLALLGMALLGIILLIKFSFKGLDSESLRYLGIGLGFLLVVMGSSIRLKSRIGLHTSELLGWLLYVGCLSSIIYSLYLFQLQFYDVTSAPDLTISEWSIWTDTWRQKAEESTKAILITFTLFIPILSFFPLFRRKLLKL